MRIGIIFGARREVVGFNTLVEWASHAERDGLSHFWVPHLPTLGYDALTALAIIARQTSRIELGTAVVPIFAAHPLTLAQHALTTQAASGGRLTLGLGLSHQPVVEGMMGLSYARPARYMEEYLAVLHPLFCEGRVDFAGQVFAVMADGTVTWMAGRQTIASHIVPRLHAAAQAGGRPQPRVCVGLPISVTDDERQGREAAATDFARYGHLVNYRRLLDMEGVAGPADVAVVGNEWQVEQQLRAFVSAGATDFLAAIFPTGDNPDASIVRTWNLLKDLNGTL